MTRIRISHSCRTIRGMRVRITHRRRVVTFLRTRKPCVGKTVATEKRS
jgi:hypothetical protein